MQTTDKLSRSVVGLAFVVSAFVLSMPIWMPINGHDGWIHLNWLEQFTRLFREGDLYPRWMPDSYSGYGSPAFYFYPPFTYWFASLVSLTGLHSGETLFHAVTIITLFLSSCSLYWYARTVSFTKETAIVGALCYAIAPYRMLDIAIRNALTEHVSFIWLPIILIGIEKWIILSRTRQERVIGAACLIFGFAFLILTNIPITVIMGVVCVVYIVFRRAGASFIKKAGLLCIGICTALLLTAFYLYPAYSLKFEISTQYIWNILGVPYVSNWMMRFGMQHQHFRDVVLLFSVGVSFVSYVIVANGYVQHQLKKVITGLLGVGIIFQLPVISGFLHSWWYLSYIQFDQRWNTILVFASAVSVMFFADEARKTSNKLRNTILSGGVTVVVFVAVYFNSPPSREIVSKYHNDPPEYLSDSVQTSMLIYPYYFTLYQSSDDIREQNKDSVSWRKIGNASYEIVKKQDAPLSIRFQLQYFSFWLLSEPRMKEIPLTTDSSGILKATLPKGKGTYYLTQVVKGSGSYDLISVVSTLLTTVILAALCFKDKLLKLLGKIK
jgi:hypothetical protein